MKRIALCLLLLAVVAGSGCRLFVDARIAESAAIDYAVVKIAVDKIDAGELDAAGALEILRALEPSLRYRGDYFEGRKPEVE